MSAWFSVFFITVPVLIILFIKPYEMHCEPKADRTDTLPIWCLDEFPNVYSYIQFVYWDNQALALFKRRWDVLLVAVPMTFLAFVAITRVCMAQPKRFLTLGVLESKTVKSFYSDERIVPHCLFFLAQMVLTVGFANADINSRVASCCLFYYLVAAHTLTKEPSGWFAWVIRLHNFGYLLTNLVLFQTEIGFI